jgi:hypothetical protein
MRSSARGRCGSFGNIAGQRDAVHTLPVAAGLRQHRGDHRLAIGDRGQHFELDASGSGNRRRGYARDVHGGTRAGHAPGWASRLEGAYPPTFDPPDVSGRNRVEVVEDLLALAD